MKANTTTATEAVLDRPGAVRDLKVEGRGPEGNGRDWSNRASLEMPEAASQRGHGRTVTPAVAAARARRRYRRLGFALSSALSLVLAAYGAYRWWEHAATWVKTDNAYIAGHVHQVSARVAGTIREVLVRENQMVQAGTVLARLDARDFEVRRQQARAQAAQAQAQRQQAQAQVAQAQAQVAREQAQVTKARQNLERARKLVSGESGAISKQEFDEAQAAADAAEAAGKAAEAAVVSAQGLAAAAHAAEQVAQANVQEAELQLSYTEIVAPATGRIGKKNLEVGNRVQPGQALLALVQPDVWVVANLKETQLRHLKSGQAARVWVDSLPGREFNGRVESVAPASGAQFALLPPDNATGNFTRIVQRVPVKITFDEPGVAEFTDRLVPGLSTWVSIRVRE